MQWIAFVDDLLFKGKILEFNPKTNIVSNPDQLLEIVSEKNSIGIVLDLEHRGIRPIEIIQQIKSVSPNARIVAYCSHAKKDLALEAKEAGAEIVVSRASFVKNLGHWLK